MNANELRIGNFIRVNRFGVDIPARIEDFDDLQQISTGHLKAEGEPITEEWLLKFGFEKKITKMKRVDYIDFRLNNFTITFTNLARVDMFGNFLRSIKYVHELQNLYFFLKTEELNYA